MVQLSMYFPKQVAIENPRLWIIQTCCGCITALVVLISLVYTKVGYVNQITPDSFIASWVNVPNITNYTTFQYWSGSQMAADMQKKATRGFYNYAPDGSDYVFKDAGLAVPCNGYTSHAFKSCITERQSYTVSKSEGIDHKFVEEQLFIPTAYNEEFYWPGRTAANCPMLANSNTSNECRNVKSYLIPGVEQYTVNIMQKYSVIPPESTYHQIFKINRDIKGRLGISLRDKDLEWRAGFAEGEIISASVGELLSITSISLDRALDEGDFPKSTLTHGSNAARARTVGAQVTLRLDYKNKIFERGPMLDIKVTGEPAWMGTSETQILGSDGAIRTRTYSGIRFRFVRKGTFEYFQMSALIYSITTFVVWIRMPAFAVFFFAVYALGTLSKIYTRYLYQDLNLHNDFNGVSARLLKRHHGFQDLHDLAEADGTLAISHSQAKKRMTTILEGRKELDEAERDFFSTYFFAQTASEIGDGTSAKNAILLNDYLKAVSSEEHLSYDEVKRFIDADNHKMTCLEKIFMDSSMKKFLNQAADLPAEDADVEATSEGEEGQRSKLQRGGTSSKLSKKPTIHIKEKQSFRFHERNAAQKLNIKIEGLSIELDDARQNRDQLVTRNNDYLHYLTHLQEKVKELTHSRKTQGAVLNNR